MKRFKNILGRFEESLDHFEDDLGQSYQETSDTEDTEAITRNLNTEIRDAHVDNSVALIKEVLAVFDELPGLQKEVQKKALAPVEFYTGKFVQQVHGATIKDVRAYYNKHKDTPRREIVIQSVKRAFLGDQYEDCREMKEEFDLASFCGKLDDFVTVAELLDLLDDLECWCGLCSKRRRVL